MSPIDVHIRCVIRLAKHAFRILLILFSKAVEFLDFVATRISFCCLLSPLHFTCSVQASTVTTLPSIAAHRDACSTLVDLPIIFSYHDFPYFWFIFVNNRTIAEAEGEVRRL